MAGDLVWRPMHPDDLAWIEGVGKAVHPDLPEPAAAAAARLRLFPGGCWVTAGGYAFAQPIRADAPPALAAVPGALPPDADALHLHDVALLPAHRGQGAGRALLPLLDAAARAAGLRLLTLIAVHGTARYWAAHGFRDAPAPRAVASYGADAVFMRREVGQEGDASRKLAVS